MGHKEKSLFACFALFYKKSGVFNDGKNASIIRHTRFLSYLRHVTAMNVLNFVAVTTTGSILVRYVQQQ